MSAPITVLLADDHARTRAMVRAALERTGDFHICAEAAGAVPDTAVVILTVSRQDDDLFDALGARASGQAARLTGREWDVLELMRKGLTTAEISDRLFVSPTTVRSHISSILRKLGVPTREEAIQLLDAREGPAPA